MSVEVRERAMPRAGIARPRSRRAKRSPYPYWFYLPAFAVFFIFFLLPTFSSFYYSLTRSVVFFLVLVSTIGVGLTFTVLMEPDVGLINKALATVGITGPRWLVA